jgi:hypothetical protein
MYTKTRLMMSIKPFGLTGLQNLLLISQMTTILCESQRYHQPHHRRSLKGCNS